MRILFLLLLFVIFTVPLKLLLLLLDVSVLTPSNCMVNLCSFFLTYQSWILRYLTLPHSNFAYVIDFWPWHFSFIWISKKYWSTKCRCLVQILAEIMKQPDPNASGSSVSFGSKYCGWKMHRSNTPNTFKYQWEIIHPLDLNSLEVHIKYAEKIFL